MLRRQPKMMRELQVTLLLSVLLLVISYEAGLRYISPGVLFDYILNWTKGFCSLIMQIYISFPLYNTKCLKKYMLLNMISVMWSKIISKEYIRKDLFSTHHVHWAVYL